ncbi:MAG: DNA alkylation repair protein [Gemmatimonadetes bacterium]|nr:DNA alkylation repair protein [Gemmatimonadota bacterium]
MNVAGEVRAVRAALAAAGTPARAAGAKAYLKSDLAFLGADTPTLRRVGGALATRVKADGDASLRPLVDALWRTRVHELRAVALVLLERRVDALGAGDLPRLERLMRASRTWAYIDWISNKVFGRMVLRVPAVRRALPRWARDDDFWVRRTALLTIARPVVLGDAPFSAFAVLALPMLGEREFFIRKAIGWVLRDVSKKSPAVVAEFLRTHLADVSGLTMREGAKYLPARDRRELLGAAAARRRARPV